MIPISKETMMASICACGLRIQYMEQHWPHCRNNPNNLSAKVKADLPFTKSELASIAAHGPMNDQPVRKVKNTGKRKSSNSKAKRNA